MAAGSFHITQKNRRIIAMALALVLASYFGYRQYAKNNKDYKLIAVWFAAIFGVSYVMATQLLRLIPESPTPDPVAPPPGSAYKPGEMDAATGSFDVLKFVKPLYDDIYAAPWVPRNTAIYSDMLSLSDKALVDCYNYWNKHYYSRDNESMTQAIAAEVISFWDTSFRTVRDELVKRLKTLNCI